MTVLALAPAAQARVTWVSGVSEESSVVSCESSMAGTPMQVVGAAGFSDKRFDPARPPRVGRTFYVRTLVGAVGDPCVAPQKASIELVLPRGVRIASGRGRPVRCFYIDLLTERRTPVPRAQGCPRFSSRGIYGRVFRRIGPLGPNWAIPLGQALEIQVPVRASRVMRAPSRRALACGRQPGGPPCSRRRAGDILQFAIKVFDGNANPYLVPHVGLRVRARRTGPTPGA